MELEINNEPEVAIKILKLAQNIYPSSTKTIAFIRLLTSAFVRVGDLRQLRWLYHNMLLLSVDGTSDVVNRTNIVNGFVLEDQLVLRTELLNAECTIGLSEPRRISDLHAQVKRIKQIIDDEKKISSTTSTAETEATFDMFQHTNELVMRHDDAFSIAPIGDILIKNRSRGATYLDELSKLEDDRVNLLMNSGKGSGIAHNQLLDFAQDGTVALANIPQFLRDLLTKLPHHSGAMPDVEAFVEQLCRTVLPPRPIPDVDLSGSGNAGNGKEDSRQVNTHMVEQEEADNDEDEDGGLDANDDIFRRRQKKRMSVA